MTENGSQWVVCADPPEEFRKFKVGDVLTVVVSNRHVVRCRSTTRENLYAQWVGATDLATVPWLLPASPPEVDPVPVGSEWTHRRFGEFVVLEVDEDDVSRRIIRWKSGLKGHWEVAAILETCTRLPDAPAPEAKPAVCGDAGGFAGKFAGKPHPCGLPPGHDGWHVSENMFYSWPRTQPQPTPPPTPAPCLCGESRGHFATAACKPAPYACAPGCTPAKPCMRMVTGVGECPGHEEANVDMGMAFYSQRGISPDLPPARSYPAGELSFTGGGATACRMTGRR